MKSSVERFCGGAKKTICALLVLAATISCPALAQPQRKAPPPPKGLAMIFDTSESMCGYFPAGDRDRKLLGLIKKSVAQRDPDSNNRIYLLKQQNKTAVDPARDIVEAPANLQALAEILAEKSARQGSGCAPFNGAGSNLELIFDPRSALANSQSMVLITDGQFLEKDREKFVQNFVEWASNASGSSTVPYAGAALVSAQFEGRYFSITDTTEKTRDSGYVLPSHTRPLIAFWFVRSEAHLSKVRELLASVSAFPTAPGPSGFVHHILPMPALGSAWLDYPFSAGNADLPALMDAKPALDIKKVDAGRSSSVIAECLKTSVSAATVVVETLARCADGRPLFDGVSEIIARFKLTSFPYVAVRYKGDTSSDTPTIAWRLTSKSFGDSTFQLEGKPRLVTGVRAAYVPFSIDSDHCSPAQLRDMADTKPKDPAKPPNGPNCVEKLDGKTYQLDVLMDQMLNRQQPVSSALLARISAKTYTFSFRARK